MKKTLDDIVRGAGSRSSQELESANMESASKGRSANVPSAHGDRIDQKKLDMVYMSVPTVHNAVNKRVQLILSRDQSIVGPNSDWFKEFFRTVGQVGGDAYWEDIKERIFQDQFLYGEAFIELIRNDEGEISDITFLDPTRMDYVKDGRQNILLDDDGNPVGYIQKVPYSATQRDQMFDPPEDAGNLNNAIYIPANNIAHFKYNTVRDGFYPVGLVEPVYRPAERSFQLQEDYADKAHTALFPTRVLKIGDEMHEPSPEKINSAVSRLKDSDVNTEMAVPYWMDLDMFEAENPEAMIEFFNQFSDEIIAGMGVPKAFVRGGGEINRATLDAQRQVLQVSLEQDINSTINTMERELFQPIAESNGLSDYPTVEFDGFGDMEKKVQGENVDYKDKVSMEDLQQLFADNM